LDVQGFSVSQRYVYNVIKNEGFDRLPRRSLSIRKQAGSAITIEAPKSYMLEFDSETFSAQNALGLLCLLPYIQRYGIDALIEQSGYPQTESISRLSSILSFLAIKLSNVKRYTADDAWCLDRGLGLFAGLNVLPKAAWFTSYSSRITRDLNRAFLKNLQRAWVQYGLVSDTANLDFTTIPYWGDASHLENNWSGTRNEGISEQIEFFHLNRLSSSMVIKVDFDLTMSILAHNLLRLFAMDLTGFSHCTDVSLFNKFLSMNGSVEIMPDRIVVKMKKKRNLPALLTAMEPFQKMQMVFMGNRYLVFTGDSTS
jgi:hypothetical protein